MVFSSLTFVYAFIPLTVLLYFINSNRTWRNGVLLLASVLFYSWGEPRLVLLMIAVACAAYFGGLGINAFSGCIRKIIYVFTITTITSNLLIFKYLNFFVDNINAVFGAEIEIARIALPIGISFYTFQILSYVIDLYRGNVKVQRNFFYLLLYLCFFPQLIAGPIVRYCTIENEIHDRKENLPEVAAGTKRFIIGLSKKALIANGVAQFAEIVYAGDASSYGTLMYWLAALAYTLQIYFDFSGYSDMAIGLGQIFGFHFLENFDHPYISTSVTEFWRRWHISLSTWFRDYIYIPLGGNRVSKARWIFNIFVVWALTGFWHGASWNFVLWGLYYCVLLVIEKIVSGKSNSGKHGRKKGKGPFAAFLGWIYTFAVINIGWVLFNITDFAKLKEVFICMFTFSKTSLVSVVAANTGIIEASIYLPIGLILMFPVGRLFKNLGKTTIGTIAEDILYLGLLFLSIVFIMSSSYNPFIYFRF